MAMHSVGKKGNGLLWSSVKYAYHVMNALNRRVTILVEEQKVPSHIQIGVLLSREGASNKILNALNMKYSSHRNLIQKCKDNGGETSMSYDEDLLYFKSNCLHYKDSVDILNEMVKAIYTSNQVTLPNETFVNPIQNEKDQILDMIIKRNDNTSLLTYISKHLPSSQHNIIAISGIPLSHLSHFKNEVHSIFKPYILPYAKVTTCKDYCYEYPIDKRIYIPFQCNTNIKLLIPSTKWNHKLTPSFTVLSEIFGNATPFSVGGPGKGIFSRSYEHILKKHPNIISCKSLHYPNNHFGLFGLDFTVQSNETHSLETMIHTLKQFSSTITQPELERAKNILNRKILFNLSNNALRLEDAARSYFYFNKVIGHDYTKMINSVSLQTIANAMKYTFDNKSKAILIVSGDSSKINKFPSIKAIINLL